MKYNKIVLLSSVLVLSTAINQTSFVSKVKANNTITYEATDVNKNNQNTNLTAITNDKMLLDNTKTTLCYANTNVNIREKCSAKSNSITILNVGDIAYKIDELDNGWSSVLYENKIRYVKSEYITIPYDLPFTEEELRLLYGIVNAEVGRSKMLEEAVNVASVIYNRVDDKNFPDTVSEVLKQRSQFSTYSNGTWKSLEITEETKLACMLAYTNRSTDALYFDSCNGTSWANDKRTFLFRDKASHNFYK